MLWSIASPRFCLLIRENNYETAITYMNPRLQLLVRWRQLQVCWTIKTAKLDLKKISSKLFLDVCRLSRYHCPKKSHFTNPLRDAFYLSLFSTRCKNKGLSFMQTSFCQNIIYPSPLSYVLINNKNLLLFFIPALWVAVEDVSLEVTGRQVGAPTTRVTISKKKKNVNQWIRFSLGKVS